MKSFSESIDVLSLMKSKKLLLRVLLLLLLLTGSSVLPIYPLSCFIPPNKSID
jgi:hypothetical protein